MLEIKVAQPGFIQSLCAVFAKAEEKLAKKIQTKQVSSVSISLELLRRCLEVFLTVSLLLFLSHLFFILLAPLLYASNPTQLLFLAFLSQYPLKSLWIFKTKKL